MTVHTIRQAKALQRASARLDQPPTHHLQLVRIVTPRRSLGDRIADLGHRLDNSPITWRLLALAAGAVYLTVLITYWPIR